MNINNIYKISIKEIKYNISNYWIFLSAFIFTALNFIIIYFSEIITGDYSQTDTRALLLSIIHLQMYLIPLLSFILSYDSILSEKEFGILDLILSYRISFIDILFGKLIGNTIVFIIAFFLGFLPVIIYLVLLGVSILILIKFLFITFWLSFIFNSFAIYISSVSGNRTTVISLSIFIWLFFIFIYDILFIFITTMFDGNFFSDILGFLLFFNPAQIFRLLSLFYFMPLDINDLFGIDVGVLKFIYIIISMFIWVFAVIFGFFCIKNK